MSKYILSPYRSFWVVLLVVFSFAVPPAMTHAAQTPPQIFTYQGRLTDSGGNLLGGSGTTYYFKFSIWNNATVGSGSRLWPTSAPTSVSATVKQGVFTVNIGDTANGYPNALNLDFSNAASHYLQVEVSSNNSTFETLSPRQQITSVAFAQLAGAVVGTTTPSVFGTTTPATNSFVTIAATSTASVPLSIIGFANQVANLFQIQDSTNTNLFSVNAAGGITAVAATTTSSFSTTASSTNLFTSNLSVGSLSGFLKATAGAVATALVNLASDVTGVLPIANGGTNQSSYTTGDVLYASAADTLSKLGIGSAGQVLKVSGGVPTWGADLTGSGGSGAFATTSDDLAIYPSTPGYVVILGASATTTTGNILEVNGNALFRTAVTSYGTVTAPIFSATSTTATSTFSGALAISGTASTSNLIASNSFTFSNVTGFLKAVGGVVSTALVDLAANVTGILPVANGGTGWAAIQSGAIPYGNGSSALATTTAGTAGNLLALLNGVPTWTSTTTMNIGGNAGTVTTNANLSGDVSSVGNTTTIGANKVTLGMHATLAANSLIGNATGAAATPTAIATSSLGLAVSSFASPNISQWTNNANYITLANLSATYPVIDTSGVFSLAFGTTTSNTWDGTQTFTNAPTLASFTGLVGANAGVSYAISTTSLNANISGTASNITGIAVVANGGTGWAAIQSGALPYGNGTSALATTTAGTAGNVLALLNGVPTWVATSSIQNIALTTTGSSGAATLVGNTLNIPQYAGTTYTAAWPVTLTGSEFGFNGLSTSTAAVIGNIPYFSGVNTFANVATSSLAVGNGLSVTSGTLGYQIGGANVSIGIATNALALTQLPQIAANTILGNATGALGNVTAIATSSLFQNASASASGLLTSTDWSTFNSKQPAGAYLTAAITGLKQTYGATQTGATQTLATSTADTNLGLTITTGSDSHTFTPYWIGTLADGRIASAATWNAKQDALTFTYPLVNTANTISSALATTSNNTWGGTQTFTNAPVLGALSGFIAGNAGSLYQVATSSIFGFTPVSNALTKGYFIVGNDAGTAQATSTIFISSTGQLGIGTTSPGTIFSLGNTGANTINISATATSTFGSGINVLTGCFAVNGVCVGGAALPTGTAGQTLSYVGTTLTATSSLFIATNQNIGIGTTTPQWALQVAGTRPSFALSDTSAAANNKHWLVSSMGGNLYIGTSTDVYATSTPAALTISNNGETGIGGTVPLSGAKLRVVNSSADGRLGFSSGGNYFSVYGRASSSNGSDYAVYGTTGSNSDSNSYGMYAGLENTDGTALAAIATNVTTGKLLYLEQSGNTFTNDAILAKMANGSGGFTGKFLNLQVNSVPKFAIDSTGAVSVGTSTASAMVSIQSTFGSQTPLFDVASTTSALFATSSLFRVMPNGNVGIGTTTPGSLLSLGDTGANTINISATATSTFGSGINVLTGCFAVNGVCVGGGSSLPTGTAGQTLSYVGTTLTATSSIFVDTTQRVGIGTTSPVALLSLGNGTGAAGTTAALGINFGDPTANLYRSAAGTIKTDGTLVVATALNTNTIGKISGSNVTISGSDLSLGDNAINSVKTLAFNGASSAASNVISDSPTAITSGNIINISHSTSAFTGNGIFFNFANSSGSFAGNFLNFQKNSIAQFIVKSDGSTGIGTSTPLARLDIAGTLGSQIDLFNVSSTTVTNVVSSLFRIAANGNIGIGTTTPGTILSLGDTGANTINISTTATSTFGSGINVLTGCFAVNGTCVGGGVTSLAATYPLLTDGATGAITISSALATTSNNTWDGTQTFTNAPVLGALSGFIAGNAGSLYQVATSSIFGFTPVSNALTKGYFLVGDDAGTAQATSTIFISSTGQLGVGTTSPYSLLSISNNLNTPANTPLFTIASTTGGTSTSTLMTVLASGYVGIGTTNPTGLLTVNGTASTSALIVSNLATARQLKIGGAAPDSNTDFSVNGSGQYVAYIKGGGSASYPLLWIDGNATNRDIVWANADYGKTSGNVMSLSTSNATFTGTGIKLNMGTNSGGNFTGKFVDFVNSGGTNGSSGPTKFSVDSTGGVYAAGLVGVGTTTPKWQIQIASSTAPQLALSDGSNTSNHWTFRNAGGFLYLATSSPLTFATSTATMLTIDMNGNIGVATTSPGSLLSIGGIVNFTAATSTLYGTGGINLTNGCFAVNGTCLSSGAALPTGTAGQTLSYVDTTLTATSSLFIATNQNIGIGTTSPFALLSIATPNGATGGLSTLFAIASSTATATTTLFSVDNTGLTTIGSSSGTGDANFQFASDNDAWSVGYNSTNKSFNIASSTSFSSNVAFTIAKSNLNVGIGSTTPYAKLSVVDTTAGLHDVLAISSSTSGLIFKVDSYGATFADGAYTGTGADYAEYFYTNSTSLQSGEVVCIDVAENNAVKRCERGADNNVMGIVSTKPSVIGNSSKAVAADPSHYTIVGMMGQVEAYVSAENGPISVGDSLTSASSTPGVAMRADGGDSTVGIALEPLVADSGKIKVLISRRNKSLAVEEVESLVVERIANMKIEDRVAQMVSQGVTNLNLDPKILNIAQGEIGKLNSALNESFTALSTDLYNLATYNLSSIQALASTTEAFAIRIDSLESRVANLESASTTAATSTPVPSADGATGQAAIVELSATSTVSSIGEWASSLSTTLTERITAALQSLGSSKALAAVLGVFDRIFAREVHTDTLCVGEVCVTEEQFLKMVQASGATTTTTVSSTNSHETTILSDTVVTSTDTVGLVTESVPVQTVVPISIDVTSSTASLTIAEPVVTITETDSMSAPEPVLESAPPTIISGPDPLVPAPAENQTP